MRIGFEMALLVYGCGSESAQVGPAAVAEPQTSAPPTLQVALETRGFHVAPGHASFAADVVEECCESGFCFGTNPSGLYGFWWLPPAPGQLAWDPWPDALGRTSVWHLGAHEAVVWVGQTPPEAAYSGLTPYVIGQGQVDGPPKLVFGALGDPLNQLVIHTDGPAAGGLAAIIVTADTEVEQQVRAALAAAGVPAAAVNVFPIPPRYANLGLDATADTFAVVHRVAVWADPEAGAAYVGQPENGVLLRASLDVPSTAAPQPVPELRQNGTGITELHLADAVLALEAAIIAAHPGYAAEPAGPASRVYVDTFDCIDAGYCGDDERDRLVSFSPRFTLGDGDIAWAVGVNHHATGKASYANLTAVGQTWSVPTDAVEDAAMVGTASRFLPEDAAAGQLFAWALARDCGGIDACTEIAETCPGAPAGTELNVTFRAYLEPATGTAPLASELVAERLLILRAVTP